MSARAEEEAACPFPENHRRKALARAHRCTTCREPPATERPPEPCLGCGEPIAYWTCAPGYCRACAHDPCWHRIEVTDGT